VCGSGVVVWLMASPDSMGTACPLSGRNSTYRPVQISGTGSDCDNGLTFDPRQQPWKDSL
jgi:hypothetical protein